MDRRPYPLKGSWQSVERGWQADWFFLSGDRTRWLIEYGSYRTSGRISDSRCAVRLLRNCRQQLLRSVQSQTGPLWPLQSRNKTPLKVFLSFPKSVTSTQTDGHNWVSSVMSVLQPQCFFIVQCCHVVTDNNPVHWEKLLWLDVWLWQRNPSCSQAWKTLICCDSKNKRSF